MIYKKALEAAEYIRSKTDFHAEIGIVLGSGLGGLAEEIENKVELPYKDIPHFVCSTAPGHKGQFVTGTLKGVPVICMQGRLHYYEGHDIKDVVFPIRVMSVLGVKNLIITNATGGINLSYNVGDLVLIEDHINFTGQNPLIGKNEEQFGVRFPDMTYAYDKGLRELAVKAAKEMGLELKQGVYLGGIGASYETPAEIRAFRILGADVVGLSTVAEVITAVHCGIKVLCISLVTNMAAGVLDRPLTEEEVLETGERKSKEMKRLVSEIVVDMNEVK